MFANVQVNAMTFIPVIKVIRNYAFWGEPYYRILPDS